MLQRIGFKHTKWSLLAVTLRTWSCAEAIGIAVVCCTWLAIDMANMVKSIIILWLNMMEIVRIKRIKIVEIKTVKSDPALGCWRTKKRRKEGKKEESEQIRILEPCQCFYMMHRPIASNHEKLLCSLPVIIFWLEMLLAPYFSKSLINNVVKTSVLRWELAVAVCHSVSP